MDYIKKNLWIATLGAFLSGILLGIFYPALFPHISFLGTWYIKILKWVVYPLLATEIVIGVFDAARNFARRLGETVLLFIVMFIVCFLITAALVALLQPGRGANLFGEAYSGNVASFRAASLFSGVMLCILISLAVGFLCSKLHFDAVIPPLKAVRRVVNLFLEYFMLATPLAVFALMGNSVAAYGTSLLGLGAKYILTAWLGCLVITFLVMVLPVWWVCGIRPLDYVRKASKVWAVSLSTCSSAATLPTTVRICNEEFGVPSEITGIVVPLGCTIHMCGGAVSFCLLALFTAQMSAAPVSFSMFLAMLFLATVMNMAAPGIPGGGIVLGATYLGFLGLSSGFIGLYSGIYRLLDMTYTTVNVTGDITANILLHHKYKNQIEKEKD